MNVCHKHGGLFRGCFGKRHVLANATACACKSFVSLERETNLQNVKRCFAPLCFALRISAVSLVYMMCVLSPAIVFLPFTWMHEQLLDQRQIGGITERSISRGWCYQPPCDTTETGGSREQTALLLSAQVCCIFRTGPVKHDTAKVRLVRVNGLDFGVELV